VYFLRNREIIMIILLVFSVLTIIQSNQSSSEVVIIDIDRTIDHGLVHLVRKATESIDRNNTVLLRINSYGGYLDSADKIIDTLRERANYCIAWIDTGSKAVSAAAYIALSCRRIYMAPGSVLGGIKPYPFEEKIVNYIESRIRSFLAEKTNISVEIEIFIKQLVREGKSYTVDELSELGIVSKASSIDEVFMKENIVKVKSIHKAGLIESILSTLTNPLVSSLLVLIGGLLIIIEILTTGFQGYAIPGIVMLVTGLYGLYLVPADVVLLLILLIGVSLIAFEILTPGFGLIGLSGVILLIIGIFIGLYNTPPEARTTSLYIALSSIIMIASFMLFIMYKAIMIVKMKKPSISDKIINQIGYAKTDIFETQPGVVYVMNEDWTAYSLKGLIKAGSKVKVVKIEGLKIYVEPVD